MKLKKHGKSTSVTEVVGISIHGLWLHVNATEYFLPFSEFPWFKDAKVAHIQDVALMNGHHLHWENLDIDLELESLSDLQKYPLKYQ